MKAKKVNEWNNSRFEYSDKKLKELLKSQNLTFEQAKLKFKRIANRKIANTKKIDYKNVKFEPNDFETQCRVLYFDELNILVTKTLVDVANNSYKKAIEEVKKLYPDKKDKKEKELKEDKIKEWQNMYVVGLRTAYIDNLTIQQNYLAYRLSNALNENLSNEVDKKQKKEEMKNGIINMNSIPILGLFKTQKKKYSNSIDNLFTFVVAMSMLEAYDYMGIEKVVRVAELDNRTCKDCEELNGEVYILGEEPEIMLHDFCRCYYEPYIE